MNIWDEHKLLLFLLFVIPGFISLKIYDHLIPSKDRDTSKIIVDVVAYSAISYTFLALPLYWSYLFELYKSPFKLFFLGLAVLLIVPCIWPFIYLVVVKHSILNKLFISPTPTAWDHVFGLKKAFFVQVTLKDGTKIHGRYSFNSFASSYPESNQIYLEEVWELEEGAFKAPMPYNSGILIMSQDISYIQFFAHPQSESFEEDEKIVQE